MHSGFDGVSVCLMEKTLIQNVTEDNKGYVYMFDVLYVISNDQNPVRTVSRKKVINHTFLFQLHPADGS